MDSRPEFLDTSDVWGSTDTAPAEQSATTSWESDSWDDWDTQSTPTQSNDEGIPQQSNFIQDNEAQSQPKTEPTPRFDNFEGQPETTFNPVSLSLGKKKVGFILAGVVIVIALIIMGIDKIHVGKRNNPQQVQQPAQQVTQAPVQQPTEAPQATAPVQETPIQQAIPDGSVVLTSIPDTMVLNYSGSVLEANGVVTSKARYASGNQVIYCVTISISFGSASESINYYCNYASFNKVSVNDVVVVAYQQVGDTYISINSISK